MRRIWVVVPLPSGRNDAADIERVVRGLRQSARTESMGQNMTAFPRDKAPIGYFTDETAATRYCEELAQANPMKPYAVMNISAIRETGQPQVLAKQFNSDGELVLV